MKNFNKFFKNANYWRWFYGITKIEVKESRVENNKKTDRTEKREESKYTKTKIISKQRWQLDMRVQFDNTISLIYFGRKVLTV